MDTGLYGLPSCPAHRGKTESLISFSTEAAAKSAGLRPCKQCRPDHFYRDRDDHFSLFQELSEQVSATPADFPNASAMTALMGDAPIGLDDLFRDHAHLTPAQWLLRARVRRAAQQLLHSRLSLADIASDAGFGGKATFARAFVDQMRMAPEDYRALRISAEFALQLPPRYRSAEILAYQARDPASLSERSGGNRIWKALNVADGPVVLELTLEKTHAEARVHATRKLGPDSTAALHRSALQILGLANEIAGFEKQHAAFVKPRRGLRLPLLPSSFDALCWAIIGQQINLSFAGALRRDMIALAGTAIGDMRAHPTPAALADLDAAALTSRRFSRSKARYLIDAAQAVAGGALDLENLIEGSAIAAERALTAQRGIGVWTARYVLMRSGFADAAPVGDSGLATALQRINHLPERPDADGTARLMSHFSPHRSLASMHLWTLLKESA